MTPEQREELRAAAEKIIDDGWYEERDKGMAIDACASDYDFIFKANPSAILSLIAQVEALTVPQGMSEKIELAWYCGYYHAGYTNDSAYAHMKAAEYAKEALSNSPEIEGIAAPTIPAIPGTKEEA